MRDYTPRRCGKRWLDGDCPPEILAIFDYGTNETDRFDVFYVEVSTVTYPDSSRVEHWQQFVSLTESGARYHGEMEAHKVAAYRYRMKHRYAKWSTLPEAVKSAVRGDIAQAADDAVMGGAE